MGACLGTDGGSGHMTDEEIMAANYAMLRQRDEEIEHAAAIAIAREKAKLRDKALPTLLNTVSTDFIDIDSDIVIEGKRPSMSTKSRIRNELLSVGSEERDALQSSLRDSKKEKRQKAKIDADSDQKWMIFRDLDAFDEADMVKVARFMETVLKVHNKLPEKREGFSDDTSRVLFNEGASAPEGLTLSVQRPYSSDVDGTERGQDTVTISSQGDEKGASLTEVAQRRLRDNSIDLRDPTELMSVRHGSIMVADSPSRSGIHVDRSMSTGHIDVTTIKLPGADDSAAGTLKKGGASTSIKTLPSERTKNVAAPGTEGDDGRDRSSDEGIQLNRKNTDPLHALNQTFPPLPPRSPKSPGRVKALLNTGDRAASKKLDDLLRKGVVITPTTALNVGTRNRSPSISSNDGSSNTGSDDGNSVEGSAKAALRDDLDKVPAGTNSSSKPNAPNFDLHNFNLPSGFVTAGVAKSIIDVYKQGGRLSMQAVHKLLRLCYRSFKTIGNTSEIDVRKDDRLTIVGDIHGQLSDLLYILDHSGLPSRTNKYIFNGDFVDRGAYGVEVMCVMMSLYLGNPGQVVMNRGNHEDFAICCVYGFQQECCSKYDEITFGMFVEVFNWLPLFATVNKAVFVLHGGLFHNKDVTLKELNCIKRTEFSLKDMPEAGESIDKAPRDHKEEFYKQLQRDALWSDPSTTEGLAVSNRGAGVMFGPDVARSFCQINGIKMIVRSHECCRSGFELPYANCVDEGDKNLIATIFSASNYGGRGNSAAYMVFTCTDSIHLSPSSKNTDKDGVLIDDSLSGQMEEGDRSSVDKDADLGGIVHYHTPQSIVAGTNLQYEVHYFAIDFQEEEIFENMNIAANQNQSSGDDDESVSSSGSGVSLTGDLSIHELVLRKKHLLLNAFELADYRNEGEVSVSVWATVMHKVLSLHINWENMVAVLVAEDCIKRRDVSTPNSPSGSSGGDENKRLLSGSLTDDEDTPASTTAYGLGDYIDYRRFLDTFSLSLEVTDSESLSDSEIGEGQVEGEGGQGSNRRTRSRQQSVTGKLVDSLYAHHHELLAVFRFFDVKKDNVISKEEFRDGMRIIRKMNMESEEGSGGNGVSVSAAQAEADEAAFTKECDMLLEIMNLNGSGFIDINDFLEMFRVSDAMKKKISQMDRGPQDPYDTNMPPNSVSAKLSSGNAAPLRRQSIKAVPPPVQNQKEKVVTVHGSVIHAD